MGLDSLNKVKNIKNFSPIKNTLNKLNPSKVEKDDDQIPEEDEEGKDFEQQEEQNKDNSIEIKEDILFLNDLPNSFQVQSKRKMPRYGLSNDMKQKNKNEGKSAKQPNFLDNRRKEIQEDESKNKSLIKLQPVTAFTDQYDQKIKPVELPYSSIEVFYLFSIKNLEFFEFIR